ncbi:hypothetical protein QTG54_000491 [Skeletonema marinoi]|uniref:Proteasome alpha-type subunits domain-containing protein n=1 Tax=Skeletonema marinoi TaxID=267567 RepID=A0AAD8YNM3_9STRA|nr:hypothetical protein QTG54_000491 [Skeletonema marinoi]
MATKTLLQIIGSLLLIIVCIPHADGARSLSARRVRGTPSRVNNRYDRSITTFDPEGRLLQLEYALIAAEERGRGLTVCVERDGIVIFAFPSSDGDSGSDVSLTSTESTSSNSDEEDLIFDTVTEDNPTHNSKIHRLSPTHLLLTSGLAGDSRTLALAFRKVVASWTHQNYGEVITTRELAAEMGKVRHSIGLRPGARVLGVIGLLIGLDENEQNDDFPITVRMYRSFPGGRIDRCNVCCTGGGADANGNLARKEAMEVLTNMVSDTSSDQLNSDAELSPTNEEEELQRIIEKVAQVALNAQMDGSGPKNDTEDECKQSAKVDIWVVRASELQDESEKRNTLSFSSFHRHLGKASMDIRYARRVSSTQLTTAARSLIRTAPKIT